MVRVLLTILVIALSGCTGSHKRVEYVIQEPLIPETFKVVPELPDAPERGSMVSMEKHQRMTSQLRTNQCILYLRYRELLRFKSNGLFVLPMPTNKQCPGISK